MKKYNLLFLLLFIPFCINAYMYSLNNLQNYHSIGTINMNDDDMDAFTIIALTSNDRAKIIANSALNISKDPIVASKNNFYMKVDIFLNEKVNIKITDSKGYPIYLRQYIPDGVSNQVYIDISEWYGEKYNLIFTNSSGITISTGEFYIY